MLGYKWTPAWRPAHDPERAFPALLTIHISGARIDVPMEEDEAKALIAKIRGPTPAA